MGWDSRKTTRHHSSAGRNAVAAHIVYVGLASEVVAEPGIQVGDRYRVKRGDVLTLGRSEACELTLTDERLAPAHALITFLPGRSGRLVLIDLRTEGGCWVNDARGTLHELETGQEFSLARAFRFRYQPIFDDTPLVVES